MAAVAAECGGGAAPLARRSAITSTEWSERTAYGAPVDLSTSYDTEVPADVLARYDWRETRNAASILRHTNAAEFDDLLTVLRQFRLDAATDILVAGGNESKTASRLNKAFRVLGWREAIYLMQLSSELTLLPFAPAGETKPDRRVSEVASPSYRIDNVKGRVALDVEWHAKDGNLDRDIAAYRALYEAGIVDGAVMVTMTRADLRAMAIALDPETKKFGTATTTNLINTISRLTRGDGGGCPILVASICSRTV